MSDVIESAAGVLRPALGDVRVPADVDFVYVLRDDTSHVVDEVTARLSANHGLDDASRALVGEQLRGLYTDFVDDLSDVLLAATRSYGTSQIHRFDDALIDARRRELLWPDTFWLSMDPLATGPDVHHLGVSRWYRPGGRELARDGHRPGFPEVEVQLHTLSELAAGRAVSVIEDDTFTGETLRAAARTLRSSGLDVRQFVVGTQICENPSLGDLQLDAAIRYHIEAAEGRLDDPIDLGDPRDYLIGVSGLVILLDEASAGEPEFGRAPYLEPFVATSARASIPEAQDRAVAEHLLRAARTMYLDLEPILGGPVCIVDGDPHFANLAAHTYGAEPTDTLPAIIDRVLKDL